MNTVIVVVVVALAAAPWVREHHHKYVNRNSGDCTGLTLVVCSFFERHHRFAGLTSVVFVWIFVCLSRNLTPEGQFVGTGSQIVRSQEFWYAVAITIL